MKSFAFASFLASMVVSTLSSTSFARQEVEIPATEILDAAHSIVPQTGPAYRVKGDLSCWSYVREIPPHTLEQGCDLKIDGKKAHFYPSRDLISILMKAAPMNGSSYQADVTFAADSISQEVPPYLVFERAVIFVD